MNEEGMMDVLLDINTNDVYKFGITSARNPEDRYELNYYLKNSVYMVTLETFNTRAQARMAEYMYCTSYILTNGKLPGSKRC